MGSVVFFAGVDYIIRRLGYSRRTIQNSISALKEKKLIIETGQHLQKNKRYTKEYIVDMDEANRLIKAFNDYWREISRKIKEAATLISKARNSKKSKNNKSFKLVKKASQVVSSKPKHKEAQGNKQKPRCGLVPDEWLRSKVFSTLEKDPHQSIDKVIDFWQAQYLDTHES